MAILIKTPQDIVGVRKSCRLAAAALRHIEPHVVEGVTTLQLNDIIEKFIRDNNAIPAPLNYMGFPKATCISVNEVICHGIPDDYAIKNGDILNIDVTTILDGYYGDTSRMFMVGDVSEEAQKLVEVAKKCLDIGIKQVRPGAFFSSIGYEIKKYALMQQYSVVYQFCGHGVGISFHEEPQICHYSLKATGGALMKPGMIFTIEPMINIGAPQAVICEDKWTAKTSDGKLSAQWEHTILVTKKGHEVLTI